MPAQIKLSVCWKEQFAFYLAFNEIGIIFWGASKPVIIMTNSKSVTRFLQTKMIPPPSCKVVLQFIFAIAHIQGIMNTGADFSSCWKWTLLKKNREEVIEESAELTGGGVEVPVY